MSETKQMKYSSEPWIVKTVPTSIGVCHKVGTRKEVDSDFKLICLYDDYAAANSPQQLKAERIAHDHNDVEKLRLERDQLKAEVEAAKGLSEFFKTNGDLICIALDQSSLIGSPFCLKNLRTLLSTINKEEKK